MNKLPVPSQETQASRMSFKSQRNRAGSTKSKAASIKNEAPTPGSPSKVKIDPFEEVEKEEDPKLRAQYIAKILMHPSFDIQGMSYFEFNEKLEYPGVKSEIVFVLMDKLKGQYDAKLKMGCNID